MVFERFLAIILGALAVYELIFWSGQSEIGWMLFIVYASLAYLMYKMSGKSMFRRLNWEEYRARIRTATAKKAEEIRVMIKRLAPPILLLGVAGLAVWFAMQLIDMQRNAKDIISLTVEKSAYKEEPIVCDKQGEDSVGRLRSLYCERKKEQYGYDVVIEATVQNNGQYTVHSIKGKLYFLKDGERYAVGNGTIWVTTGNIVRGSSIDTIISPGYQSVRALDNNTHLGDIDGFMREKTPFEIEIISAERS